MKPGSPTPSGPLGPMIRRRLHELERTPTELADALQLPQDYVDDLISGRRRPPQPGWTDLYDRMTQFLKLGRNDLATHAIAERAERPASTKKPDPKVRQLMMGLCEPTTAAAFTGHSRRLQAADEFVQRLLEVVQASVRHDALTFRATTQPGRTHVAMRGRVFEFLDVTADSLTVADFEEFVRPRIAMWDVDQESGVVRVVFRGREPRGGGSSAPSPAAVSRMTVDESEEEEVERPTPRRRGRPAAPGRRAR